MRLAIALLTAAAALGAAAGADAAGAGDLELRDLAARVTVVPEDRSDIKVEVLTTHPELPIHVSTVGGTTLIDGDLAHRITGCHLRREHPSVRVRGVGALDERTLPQVVIRTPRTVSVSSSGAVFGAIGRSAGLELRDSGCSSWTIADVAGDAALHESGAGAVRMGAADRLEVHLSGAARVHATQARKGLEADLSGAGDLHVEDVAGPVEASISGLGKVRVAGGHASTVRASVSGVGGVEFGGVADSLRASISGLGSVRVKQVTGEVAKSVSGIGRVTIDQRPS